MTTVLGRDADGDVTWSVHADDAGPVGGAGDWRAVTANAHEGAGLRVTSRSAADVSKAGDAAAGLAIRVEVVCAARDLRVLVSRDPPDEGRSVRLGLSGPWGERGVTRGPDCTEPVSAGMTRSPGSTRSRFRPVTRSAPWA